MSNAWDYLPNAAHIDAVIASLEANPDEWVLAWVLAYNAAWEVARRAAWNAAWNAKRDAALNAAWSTVSNTVYDNAAWTGERSARAGILALVTYNDCAHMLDSEPDDLRLLSRLGSHTATLMIPAAIAFKIIREKQVVVL